MRIFTSADEAAGQFTGSVVTVGKFDGVHLGHRAVIGQLIDVARAKSIPAVAVTFDRNPLAFLRPDVCPPNLISVEQKLELLEETGLDAVLIVPFDARLAALSPTGFVQEFLVESLHASIVLVGQDFRFGAGGAGNVDTLRGLGERFGFTVELIDDVMPDGQHRVSSTRIRELLQAGDVGRAGELLGHIPTVRGIVVHGAKRGRELGFPTANLSPESQGLIPADGVYAGWFIDGAKRYPAAISVGSNPTFDGVRPKQVEAFVLDEDLDLYGHDVDVEFVARIRGMVKYEGVEPLIKQMADDVVQVRSLL
jgi:riboflavin kinase/FMN adenylyltransferase